MEVASNPFVQKVSPAFSRAPSTSNAFNRGMAREG